MTHPDDTIVDEFLVLECQAGNREALSALIARWQPAFLRYATVMVKNPDLAADVLQDAWMKIIRSIASLREPLKFPGWAYRIINNQCLDVLRAQRPEGTMLEMADTSAMKSLEHRDQVWWILEQLTPEHRSVLALHYLQGFEVAEIAKIVGKPTGTVKSRLFNAREKFRQVFDEQIPDQTNAQPGETHERTGQSDTGGPEHGFRTA